MGFELEFDKIDGKVVVLMILVGFIALVKFFFSESAITKRRLKRSSLFAIGEFPEGAAGKIAGVLKYDGKPLRAPLTGRRCACYHVVVRDGDDDGQTTLIEDRDHKDFVLEDHSGRALVKVFNPRIAIVEDVHLSSGTFEDASPRIERFLRRHGHKSTGFLGFNRSLAYVEGALEKGERVAVFGVGKWSVSSDQEKILIVEGTQDVPLRISDDAKVL